MGFCRFTPLLILCCALDLAIPVAPTVNGGIEFEEDEEVLRMAGRPHALKASVATRHSPWSGHDAQRPRLDQRAALAHRPRPDWLPEATRAPLSRADATSAPPPGEDH